MASSCLELWPPAQGARLSLPSSGLAATSERPTLPLCLQVWVRVSSDASRAQALTAALLSLLLCVLTVDL